MKTESAFAESVLVELEPHFYIHREVRGTHFSGTKLRIDCVIKPKDSSGWKNQDVAFGIEFKAPSKIKEDFRDYSGWLAQCVDYAHTDWNGFGYLYVLACPGIAETHIAGAFDAMAHIMGQIGIGELKQLPYHGWAITLHDQHRLWSQSEGVKQGRNWSLERKWGSR
jgi:hypothetical protein